MRGESTGWGWGWCVRWKGRGSTAAEARARNLGPLVLDGEDVFRPHVPRLLVVKHHLVHRIACALSYTCMLGCLLHVARQAAWYKLHICATCLARWSIP